MVIPLIAYTLNGMRDDIEVGWSSQWRFHTSGRAAQRAFNQSVVDNGDISDKMVSESVENFQKILDPIEKVYENNEFSVGDSFSIVDLAYLIGSTSSVCFSAAILSPRSFLWVSMPVENT